MKITHKRSPIVEIGVTPEMIEKVLSEWEAENPGKDAMRDMGEDEFAKRMMLRIRASARIIPDG